MTTVSALNGSSNIATAASASKKNALGQDQFLTLLVAQLQNQDPLNPTDPTEFTTQLAQYSQLEQLFNLNDAMNNLTDAQTSSQKIAALSLIGKEVVVEDSKFSYDGTTAKIGYMVDGTASDITLQIQNSTGTTVATIKASDTSQGEHYLSWDGLDKNGLKVEAGTYALVISAKSGDDASTVSVSPLVRARVTGVDLSGSDPMIVTATGEYRISGIHGAYDASQSTASGSTTTSAPETVSQQTAATDSGTIAASAAAAIAAAAATENKVSAATDGAGIIEESIASAVTK